MVFSSKKVYRNTTPHSKDQILFSLAAPGLSKALLLPRTRILALAPPPNSIR